MYGTHTGNLSAIISTEQRSIPVWSARSNHGNRWFTEYLQLQFTEDFQVTKAHSEGNKVQPTNMINSALQKR